MYCSKCGAENVEDASFCNKCGSKLTLIKEKPKAEEKNIFIEPKTFSFNISLIKNILLNPTETLYNLKYVSNEKDINNYLLSIFTIFAILSISIWVLLGNELQFKDILTVGGTYGEILIMSYIIHGIVHLLGGQNGINYTKKAVYFGYSPIIFMFLMSIMNHLIVSIIIYIWIIYLVIIGLKQYQQLSTIRAIISVSPLVALILILNYLLFWFLSMIS